MKFKVLMVAILIAGGAGATYFPHPTTNSAPQYFANGIKIGEVDQNSAIIWTRLTANPSLNLAGAKFKEVGKHPVPASKQLPAGKTLADMEGAVPGVEGSVSFNWMAKGSMTISGDNYFFVSAETDYTTSRKLTGLKPGTEYIVEAMSSSGTSFKGSFKTAPDKEAVAPITFAVVTGQDFDRRDDLKNGHKIYPQMKQLGLDFMVHTGDIEYYDKPRPYATNLEFARFKMARMYGLPNLVEFHRSTPSYFIKDDHDTTMDDAWPGKDYRELTWQQGVELFREQFPVLDKNYRTIRWGKDLQIWLVEGRDFRSANKMPDGPEKTIWGKEQKAWFFKTVGESDASFRVLVSPTPIVGPDRSAKNDNHANAGFKHEGDEIRKFIASQENMFIACGDRHWQYVSVDGVSGIKEFSCGPTSQKHAGGWKNSMRMPEHRYLNVQGGFMTITVERRAGKSVLLARHYNVEGTLCNEDVNPEK